MTANDAKTIDRSQIRSRQIEEHDQFAKYTNFQQAALTNYYQTALPKLPPKTRKYQKVAGSFMRAKIILVYLILKVVVGAPNVL